MPVVGIASPALADDPLVTETFTNGAVADPHWRAGGTNFMPCLTASTDTAQRPIPGCGKNRQGETQYGLPAAGDPEGGGVLRLTDDGHSESGFVLYNVARPFTAGLRAEFEYFSYGGTGDRDQPGGDGLSMFLVDGRADLTEPGSGGGSLGYAQRGNEPGVSKGFLGVGLDEYGNFANDTEGRGYTCPTHPADDQVPNSVSLRGPGDGIRGYCLLKTKKIAQAISKPGKPNVRTSPGVGVKVRFTVDPATAVNPRVRVELDFGSGYVEQLNAPLPKDAPPTFKFGFAAGTGSATNVHEIRQLRIDTIDDLPRLTIKKSHTGTFTSGGIGEFTLRARVGVGVERRPVTVTDRLPAGLTVAELPSGTGWDCSATRVGTATADCRYTVTPVAADTDLPPISLKVRVARGEHGTFTNVAIVGSDDNANSEQDSTATDTVVVPAPPAAIKIIKTAPTAPVRPGDPVRYTITVRNAGEVRLDDVRVHDPRAASCDRTFGALGIGEVRTYTCDLAAPAQDFTNTATATGTGPGGNVTDSSAATVTVVHPAVMITKETPADRVHAGDEIEFTITVRNDGDTPLTDVAVSDSTHRGCSRTVPDLPVGGAPYRYQCRVVASGTSLENTATVTARPTLGPSDPVHDSASAVVQVDDPKVEVTKSVDRRVVRAGDQLTYTITAHNTGDVPLTDVKVTDPVVPACAFRVARLEPGTKRTHTCTAPAPDNDVTNTAVVTGRPPTGPAVKNVSPPVTVTIVHPQITVTKRGPAGPVLVGDPVTFELTVTNTGDVGLRDIDVADAAYPGCSFGVTGVLAPGERRTHRCTVSAPADSFENEATAKGTPTEGRRDPVTDTDRAMVGVHNPQVAIAKSADRAQVREGDTVTYTFRVTNTGNVPLTDVVVSDAALPSCRFTATELAVSAVRTFTCRVLAPRHDLTNVAIVSGDPPSGDPVTTPSDPVTVKVIHPELRVTKVADRHGPVAPGTLIGFTVTVRNTGDVALTQVRISDVVAVGCATTIPLLARGAVHTVRCTAHAGDENFENVATVVGQPPVGTPVTGSDVVRIAVTAPRPPPFTG